MASFPKPQQPYYQQPQFLQQPSIPPMTPFVPPNAELPTIPQAQRYPQPYQPPILPQYIPQVNPVVGQIPPTQSAIPFQVVQQVKLPPPQPQRPSPISSNLTKANKDQYVWSQKKDKMKWGIAESLELDQIVRHGDLKSVLFYMNQFMNANLTKEDAKKFGTKGALNAFLILQLGTEFLLNECNRLEAEIEENIPANEQANIDLYNQFNEKIDTFNSELQKRDNLISQYKKQNDELKNRLNMIKNAQNTKEKKKKKPKNDSTFETQTHPHDIKKLTSTASESDEPGRIHDQTDVKNWRKHGHDLSSSNSKISSVHKSKKDKEQSDVSKSEGEIEVVSFLPESENDTEFEYSKTAEFEEEEEEGDDY